MRDSTYINFLARLKTRFTPFIGKVWVYIEVTATLLYTVLVGYVVYLAYKAPRWSIRSISL